MGGNFSNTDKLSNAIMLGLDKAGKTHMLYTYKVGDGGMDTIKKLKNTLGMNYEQVTESVDFNVWDVSGNKLLRKHWKLYAKSIPISAVIYVVNISEEIDRVRESQMELSKIINESSLFDCILAIVYNNKPYPNKSKDNNNKDEDQQ